MKQDVYTLLCRRDLEMAMTTVPMIIHFLDKEQQFIIVDDGSFDEYTVDALQAISPKIEILTKNKREEFIINQLKDKENCLNYRKTHPLAFKLLDIPLIAKSRGKTQRFTYTDSDILYLKDCTPYFDRTSNTYLKTDAIKLSIRLQKAMFKYKWPLPIRFNSGYFSFDLGGYDLDFVDSYLGSPDVRNIVWLTEQTCWSILFGKSGISFCPDENQFICKEDFTGPNAQTKAVHLIADLKEKFFDWSKGFNPNENEFGIREVSFHRSRNVNMLDWAFKTSKRILGKR